MTENILTFIRSHFPAGSHDQIALVGGSVRDMMLGTESRDLDLVAALSHAELLALGFRLVEATSGATVYFGHYSGIGKVEVTRIDSMDALAEDLRRRDFTVNAMAKTLSGVLIDPLNGGNDLAAGLLRPCGSESFNSDPLRIFRAFRFEADGWSMTLEAEELIRQRDWSGAFAAMPVERFSNEMLKALAQKNPERFFQRMIEFGVGEEFLAELFRMPLIPAGPPVHHPEGDLLTHSVQVLQRVALVSKDPLARFCAFFHDLGKLATDPALYPKHHGHDEAGFKMTAAFCDRLCLPAAYRTALAWTSRLHGKANRWAELRDATKLKMAAQAAKGGIAVILELVSLADKPGSSPMTGWDEALRIAGMSSRELAIDQEKLNIMPAGKRTEYIMQIRVELFRVKQRHSQP